MPPNNSNLRRTEFCIKRCGWRIFICSSKIQVKNLKFANIFSKRCRNTIWAEHMSRLFLSFFKGEKGQDGIGLPGPPGPPGQAVYLSSEDVRIFLPFTVFCYSSRIMLSVGEWCSRNCSTLILNVKYLMFNPMFLNLRN